ncbi:MAG: hypothetical protein ABW217_12790 [Polyangiaceae bacterium]
MKPSCFAFRAWTRGARIVLLGGVSWLAGTSCGGEAETATLQPSFGTLFVPLETTGASGATYELVDGVLSLAGSETLRLTLDGSSEETRLLSGPYSVTLVDGWQLYRAADGERSSVQAQLRSPNPARVQILQGETTSFTLRFRVDGDDIALGEDSPADDDDGVQVGGGGSSSVDNEGPDGLEDPGDDDADDGDDPDDASTPDAGVMPEPAAVCDAAGARCLDAIVQQASATPALSLCIPADQLASPLGPIDVCEGQVCASGVPGCPVQADASATTAELDADGLVRIDAVALLTPLQVPVAISVPLFGSINCPVAVSGVILAAADAEPNDDAQGRITGFGLTDIGTNLDEVTLELATNNALCAVLEPLLPELRTTLEPQIADAIGDSLEDSLDELAARLACVRCEAACVVQCVDR